MPIKPENRDRYPENWPVIRELVRVRAGDKCEGCGVPNHTWIIRKDAGWEYALPHQEPKVYIRCTTAHLDHQPENCAMENLRFWCQKCHNRYDAPHRVETRAQTRRQEVSALQPELVPVQEES